MELTKILYGESYENHLFYKSIIDSNPKLQGNPAYYDMDRLELMINSMEIALASFKTPLVEREKDYYFTSTLNFAEYLQGQVNF